MKKRMLAALLGFAMGGCLLAGCAGQGAAATKETAAAATAPASAASAMLPADPADTLVILHTNDVHGRLVASDDEAAPVYGAAELAATKKDYEAQGYKVLLLSAGDDLQGMPLVNLSKGATAVQIMNAVGYDAVCPGNHEFDWGTANAVSAFSQARFRVLAANITHKDSGELLFEGHTIFDLGPGMKIGVFGLDTPMTTTTTNPANVADISFTAGRNLFSVAQEQVEALKDEDCDLIVCVGHLGVDLLAAPSRSYDVIDNVTGIDVFIDGYSHKEMTENRGKTLLQSTGSFGASLGKITWDTASKKAEGTLIPAAELTAAPDPEVEALVNGINDGIQAELSKTFATTEVALNGDPDNGVRTQETNLGDLTTDAILWKARQVTGRTIDAAIENGGGIRDSIPVGDITMNDIKTVFPFDNTVSVVSVTGAQLLEALEASTGALPDGIGAFPQVSGIVFSVDTQEPYINGELYPDTTVYAPANPGARVRISEVGGKPFDASATYTIATNEFLAAGGDTFYVFSYAGAGANTDIGVALEDAMIDYITDELGGVIGQEYAEAKDRIVIR